ncbi:MAG TPA: hypothetical protein VGI66_03650 [Streptosporangiaceae bacterium]|jgi:hypothetical protein
MASSGIPGSPVAIPGLVCPRCKLIFRDFFALDGQTLFRCSGCEWYYTFSAVAPTGTSNAPITAGVTTSISVASGGASFTLGMTLFIDTGVLTEVVVVNGSPTGTTIPCGFSELQSGANQSVTPGFQKSHLTAMTFGQLLIAPTVATANHITPVGGWGF